jgi:hypothetical protein
MFTIQEFSMVWKPGASGNPGGTRRTKPFYEALRLEIAAAGDDHKALRRVARALIERAAGGDTAAISVLADRLDGRVPQPTGQADELGPQRLEISWRGAASEPAREVEQEPVMELAEPQSEEDAR